MSPRHPDLVKMRQTLAELSDGKLAQVVALLDTFGEREAAETLLVPLRPRLRQLHVRRISLGRLVILPVERLLADTRTWQVGGIGVPRSALRPLLSEVTSALKPLRETLPRNTHEFDPADRHALLAAGRHVWPAAAEALAKPPRDEDAGTGMPPAEYQRIRRMVTTVLAHATAVQAIATEWRLGMPDPRALDVILREAAEAGPDAFAAQLKVLLAHLPLFEGVLLRANAVAASHPALRTALHASIASLLEDAGNGPPCHDDLSDAVAATERVVSLLEQLANLSGQSAAFTAPMETARHAALDTAHGSIGHATKVTLPMLAARAATNDGVRALERSARDLRRLVELSRRLGPAYAADRMLREAAEATLEQAPTLAFGDRARLVELLCGAQEALAWLERHQEERRNAQDTKADRA